MSLFEHPDFDNHEQLAFQYDKVSGLRAIIAVHNTRLGPSLGGCRMWPYATSAEALTDVLRLSCSMSYKAAMAGLPQGGGKAVIIGDPRKHKSSELMRAMGRFVDSMQGRYIIAEDSGISVQDIDDMATQTKFVSGNNARYSFDGSSPDGNPAPSTAFGVFCGIQAAVKFVCNSDLSGKKVAIQGVGHVGLRLARHLHNAGAKLYVSDIYSDNLALAEKEFGATIVDNTKISQLDVDVYSPCAMGGAINNQTVKQLNTKIIAGAANNQLASKAMDEMLQQRGIVYVPDYVINAGGIIDLYHQNLDHANDTILCQQLTKIGDTVTEILTKSSAQRLPSQQIANAIAEQRLAK